MATRRPLARPRPPVDTRWHADAACQGEPFSLFFAPDGERQPDREIREHAAKQVCAPCPVRAQCLEYALTRPEKYGTWGGLGEEERAAERRRWLRNRRNAA